MSDAAAFTVFEVAWNSDAPRLRQIRHAVFVIEQGVPETEEWDAADPACRHVLALARDGTPIGTGRLDTAAGKIGRMAVLPAWRGRNVGKRILELLLQIAATQGLTCVYLNAQERAREFYRRCGFEPVGAPFLEVDIPHIRMEMEFSSAQTPPARR